MKRKTLLILAVLLTAIACLFTSCSASVEPPKEEEGLAYVTFGNGGSRSLSTEYGIKSYGELYWFYTAVKQDGFGLTGQKTEQTRINNTTGLNGTITLSQGAWKFKLFAYEGLNGTAGKNLVYQGESATIVLKGGETKAVPVSVELKGEYGTLDFSGAYFKWEQAGTGDVYLRMRITGKADTAIDGITENDKSVTAQKIIKVVSPDYYFVPNRNESIDGTIEFITGKGNQFPAGYYTFTVDAFVIEDFEEEPTTTAADNGVVFVSGSIKGDATAKSTQQIGLRVYGNATTRIADYLEENSFSNVVFDVAKQDMKVFVPDSNGCAEVTGISVTPAGTGTTSVTFSEKALSGVSKNATLQLDVKVTPVEAAFEKFQVSGTTAENKSAFAGIDITLMQTTANGQPEPVESFNDDPSTTATVTTYIATGLTGVSVHYASDEGETEDYTIGTQDEYNNNVEVIDGFYDPETGMLVFKTTHFSEYYVLANCVAFNSSRNVAYATLEKAIDYAQAGDIVKLMADYTIPASNKIEIAEGKNFTLDLNGKTITEEGDRARKIVNRGVLTIKDSVGTGNIKNSAVGNPGQDGSYGLVDNYGILNIENGNFTDVAHGNGSSFRNRPGATLIINGGTFLNTADDSSKPNGKYDGSANAFVYSDGKDVRINGGSFTMEKAMYTPAIKIMKGTGRIEGASISTYKSGGIEVGCEVEIRNTTISVSEANSHYATAIAVSNDGKANVYGGTLTGNKYGAYIYSSGGIINIYGSTITAQTALRADNDVYYPNNSEINVYGGSFSGGYTVGTEAKLTITGGTFSADPSAYVAEWYCAIAGEYGNYTVQVAPVRIGEEWYASLNDAIIAATDGAEITLGEGEFSTDDIESSNAKGKTITFVGQGIDKTSWTIGSNVNQGVSDSNVFIGANLTLKQMKIVADPASARHKGFQHVGSVSYESCKIVNQLTLYGANESFNDCVLEYKDDYPIWTWGSRNVTFTDCTFNTGGKAILLYGGAGGTTGDSLANPTTSLTVNNCIFYDDGTLDADKAAIETGNDYTATYIINVNSVTVNGFAVNPKGTSTGSTIWGNKNSMDGDHLVVTIDGNRVYPSSN